MSRKHFKYFTIISLFFVCFVLCGCSTSLQRVIKALDSIENPCISGTVKVTSEIMESKDGAINASLPAASVIGAPEVARGGLRGRRGTMTTIEASLTLKTKAECECKSSVAEDDSG